MKNTLATAASLLAVATCAFAQDAAPAADLAAQKDEVVFRWGGDFRLRQEAFDNIPVKTEAPAVARGGNNNYFRFRTRVNGGIDVGDVFSINARALNELRLRNVGQKSYEWPDEVLLDQLNFQLKGLFDDRVDVTVGRQDVRLGSGRLFAEGTGKDGSRSQFFDGVLVRAKAAEKTTLDLFGFYNKCESDLVLGHEHRDLTGYSGGYNQMDEASAGFFLTDRTLDEIELGLYYVWKHDTAWYKPNGGYMPSEDIHTIGFRLQPRFAETLTAEVEAATQFSGGDYDRDGDFLVVGLRYGKAEGFYASANGLYLSGDDPETREREDFNILYGRYPWISELMLYGLDGVGNWQNLVQCWAEAGYLFGKGHSLKATAGPLFAPESDGAGGGHDRGWLETVFYSFPIPKCKGLTGHLFLEILEPGDYYVSDKTAYFFRWQLNWAF